MENVEKKMILAINGENISIDDAVSGHTIRSNISELIKTKYPNWTQDSFLLKSELKVFRQNYLENLIQSEMGELNKREKEVISSMVEHDSLVKKIMSQEEKFSLGERLADRIADFAGSWAFISIFFVMLVFWIAINSINLLRPTPDPYPYMLLNMILSCLAAIQAPIIIMSQNRQEVKDRKRQEDDYIINLKSELELRILHEKIDHLAQSQWKRLLEIQQLQAEMLDDK